LSPHPTCRLIPTLPGVLSPLYLTSYPHSTWCLIPTLYLVSYPHSTWCLIPTLYLTSYPHSTWCLIPTLPGVLSPLYLVSYPHSTWCLIQCCVTSNRAAPHPTKTNA